MAAHESNLENIRNRWEFMIDYQNAIINRNYRLNLSCRNLYTFPINNIYVYWSISKLLNPF